MSLSHPEPLRSVKMKDPRDMAAEQPDMIGDRKVCRKHRPYDGGSGRWCHPDAISTGDDYYSDGSGYANYRCPNCGLEFGEELVAMSERTEAMQLWGRETHPVVAKRMRCCERERR